VAATREARRLARLLGGLFGSLFGGLFGNLFAIGGARAVDLPEDRAEAMIHLYDGGGTRASGPAVLVRKSVADRVALSGNFYVDMVSNASIDVVTQASPYKEKRTEYTLGADYVVRDSLIKVSTTHSHEPDYSAGSASLDISQDVFGGMTTVNLGFTRGSDTVGKKGSPDFVDHAGHWQYRLGATQILTPHWLASANFEAVADDGFLGSPYRAARVFGAAVPERDPRTRSSRAAEFRVIGDLGNPGEARSAVHGSWRYFWDTWNIRAQTGELGYSRYFGESFLGDAFVRFYSQTHALFYSDNATSETLYVSRNRQLSTFHSITLGTKLTYTYLQVPGKYDVKFNGAFDLMQFKYADFTDIRSGTPYKFTGKVLQLYVTSTF